MRVLSQSLGFSGPPVGTDAEHTKAAFEAARRGRIMKEIRVGVGPLSGPLPARVLGYGACIANALRSDPAALEVFDGAASMMLFSSAPKSGCCDYGSMLMATCGLGGALRLLGVDLPIIVEATNPDREVPDRLCTELPADVADRVNAAARRHCGTIDYAYEHAAPSMFGDLLDPGEEPSFRITVGGETEGLFWAVRMQVRQQALSAELPLAPAMAILLRGVQVPWYYPLAGEPLLAAMRDPAAGAAALRMSSNPIHGGNTGIKKEAVSLGRLGTVPGLDRYLDAFTSVEGAVAYADEARVEIGPRLRAGLEGAR
jgi:hypothetical protein